MIHKHADIFCWKNVSSFCNAKATHIFSAKNIRILYIESAKTVNEMTLNELVKLTTLWTTGPRMAGSIMIESICKDYFYINLIIMVLYVRAVDNLSDLPDIDCSGICCFICVLHCYQQFYSHLATVSWWGRELNAHFKCAASLKLLVSDIWHDIPPSCIILTSGWPVLIPSYTFPMLRAKWKSS